MTLRAYLLLMAFSTLLAWMGWAFVITNIQPGDSGIVGVALFFLTLFVALIGSLTLTGMLVRVVFLGRRDVMHREVRVSFRHAVLLSVVAACALLLSSQGWFHWWTLFVLIVISLLAEYLSLIVQESRRG